MDFDIRRYFIVYKLESPSALSSDDYVRKLNNPTSWSQRIMPTLKNFVRGGGVVTAASGTGHGGFAAAVALEDMRTVDAELLVSRLVNMGRICSARFLKVDKAKTSISTLEKWLRREDKSFANLLMLDGLDAGAVRAALDTINSASDALCRHWFTSRSISLIAGRSSASSPGVCTPFARLRAAPNKNPAVSGGVEVGESVVPRRLRQEFFRRLRSARAARSRGPTPSRCSSCRWRRSRASCAACR